MALRPWFGPADPARVLRWGVWLVVGLLAVAVALRVRAPAPADNPAYDALAAAHSRKMAADAVALGEAQVALRAAADHVHRDVVRYSQIRDTLNIHDTLQVIVFRERADSLKRSCADAVESCDRFRVRAESSLAGVTLDRDRWKLEAESRRPSKWRGALPYVAFVGGVWMGSRVVR